MTYKEENWFKIPLVEQLANIGIEVFRAIKWKNKWEKYFNSFIYYAGKSREKRRMECQK